MKRREFELAEQEYFKLRGQFSAGRIDADEFDAALHELVVEDEAGRVWMLGANSAQWYYYDGSEWIAAAPNIDPAPEHELEPAPLVEEQTEPTEREGRGARAVSAGFLLIALVLFVVAALAMFLVMQDTSLLVSANSLATPTRRLPPTALPTAIPETRVAVVPPAQSPQAAVPSRASTAGPPDGVIEIATPAASPTLVTIPTITPPVPDLPGNNQEAIVPPNLPEGINGPLPLPSGSLPPNVYVTGLHISPTPGQRREPMTFTATFVNTTGGTVYYHWRIVLLDPNKQGRNKDWGESPLTDVGVAPGVNQYSITYTPVSNRGGCITLQAKPAWRRNDNARIFFNDPLGGVVTVNFQVC